ncbi:MAG: S46 family peptidase [Candidatus Eisenbacteria bacterium]
MKMIPRTLAAVAGCAAIVAALAWPGPGRCEEGMWLPHELPDEVMTEMHEMGLELSREEIYNTAGTGVANAVVKLGATGSFVSKEGLILTNHHVAFGAVQRISTPAKNYIENGFLAQTRDAEAPAYGYTAQVIKSTEDVTQEVLSAVERLMSPLHRYKAIEQRKKEIIRKAEAGRDVYCEVREFSGGSKYLLYTFLRIKDVRVVYVPSRAIGEYGGDIDNWMWPRHTGDFSFLRAYVAPDGSPAEFSDGNVPYRPTTHLKIAPEGLKDGDFSMIIGFPGRTRRYLTSYALRDFENFEYPERIRLYKEMVGILDGQSRKDPVAAVRVASMIKTMNNRLKNNEGMLEGFKRFGLVKRQQDLEQEIRTYLASEPSMNEKYGRLLAQFKATYDGRAKGAMRDLLLDMMFSRGTLLTQAMLLYKWSIEKEKDDMDRDPDYMDRWIPDNKRKLRFFQMSLHLESDRALLRMFLHEMLRLPEGQRVEVVDELFDGKTGSELEEAIEIFLDDLYAGTELDDRDERLALFDMSHEELLGKGDTFIALAARLYDEEEARIRREQTFDGGLHSLTPKWMDLIAEWSGHEPYPDANGTMRLNFGEVKGYSPDGEIHYTPFTAFQEVAAKNTGVAPFDCPERLLELAAGRGYSSYLHPALGDVPVNLLTTHDSTGGNSGSPLLNARGELVGCLFDGNYEAMTADFAFQNDITRSIHVDIRYVLFIAEFVDGAHNVLKELGIEPGD